MLTTVLLLSLANVAFTQDIDLCAMIGLEEVGECNPNCPAAAINGDCIQTPANAMVCCAQGMLAPTVPQVQPTAPIVFPTLPAPRVTVPPQPQPPQAVCVDINPWECQCKSYLCRNPQYTRVMTVQCPRTCGFCPAAPRPNPPCADTQPAQCEQNANLCNVAMFKEVMAKDCRRTCGLCIQQAVPDRACVDKVPEECQRKAFLCQNQLYFDLMNVQCPRTCNRCPAAAPLVNCVDANPQCGLFVPQGFCTNDFYNNEFRRQHCARSCGLC